MYMYTVHAVPTGGEGENLAVPRPRDTARQRRPRLTRERVIAAAVQLADRAGIAGLSMRALSAVLGVEPMALYNHIANKDALLDAMIDRVAEEFALATADDWKDAIRSSATSAHEVLLRHPWACALAVTRPAVGPAMLRYAEALVDAFHRAGFSTHIAHHGLHAIDNHVFGFTLQELNFPQDVQGFGPEMTSMFLGERSTEYPNLTHMISTTKHDHRTEFGFLLDLILDGLERAALSGLRTTS